MSVGVRSRIFTCPLTDEIYIFVPVAEVMIKPALGNITSGFGTLPPKELFHIYTHWN